MQCPYLREATVRNCDASAYRKMLVRAGEESPEGMERCSSAEYAGCPTVIESHAQLQGGSRCPFLRESQVHYCSASPVTKFIPYSPSTLARCGSDTHRYCGFYCSRSAARPEGRGLSGGRAETEPTVDGITVPGYLRYTPNHLWLDIDAGGRAHAGVDGFMARAMGRVTGVNYLSRQGKSHPAVILTVAGIDLPIVVPAEMSVTGTNSALLAQPERLTADPYALGWLFEGSGLPQGDVSGFLGGAEALPWMHDEVRRFVGLLHEFDARDSANRDDAVTMADGGVFTEGVVQLLGREEIFAIYNDFFSADASRGA